MDLENSKTLKDWEKWKETLSKAVNLGETIGLSQKTISNMGYRVGNMLTSSIDPENREERLLQELWRVGDDEDRRVLAKLMVKMVKNENLQ